MTEHLGERGSDKDYPYSVYKALCAAHVAILERGSPYFEEYRDVLLKGRAFDPLFCFVHHMESEVPYGPRRTPEELTSHPGLEAERFGVRRPVWFMLVQAANCAFFENPVGTNFDTRVVGRNLADGMRFLQGDGRHTSSFFIRHYSSREQLERHFLNMLNQAIALLRVHLEETKEEA